MFTTGDFSRIARVTRRTLRHYREVGLFEPVLSDADNGYHYYTTAQLPRLNRILALRELGFGLDQIRRMVDDAIPVDKLRGLMRRRKAEIEQDLQRWQQSVREIESRLQLLERGVADYEIVVKRLPSRSLVRRGVPVQGPRAREGDVRAGVSRSDAVDRPGPARPVHVAHARGRVRAASGRPAPVPR